MSLLDSENIVQCQCCGNRDSSLITERDGGYVCKCCGVWYKKKPTDAEFREQMWVMQGYSQLRAYRFGDARDTFENILAEQPENINALWGLILARYGVVYVKGFYKGVVEPIYCFPNYERMKKRYVQNEPEYEQILDILKNDNALRYDYEKKAEKIDDALDNFKKYKESTERDVFICVKISAATMRHPELVGRTKDYEFALELYNELTRRGVNAFYSFVTLENDVKSDEKIWRNLVTSKKMLLIGSCEEYLESPWVKSEWKRWLHLRREQDFYVCALHEKGESPFDILPQEILELEPQIYTRETREKLVNDICKNIGVASAPAYIPPIAPVEPPKPAEPPKPVENNDKDGKIVYKDGRVEVLKYGITAIELGAYARNKDIVSVVLPNSVKVIGESAFCDCEGLTSVIIPNSVTAISLYAFQSCHSLTSIEIPNGVKTIGENAFYACRSLAHISIPGSVTAIGVSAFHKCGSLEITVSPENKHYKVIDNNLYTYDGKTLVQYIPRGNASSCAIPNGVTVIGDWAFSDSENLESVEIPNSVKTIGENAFDSCENLVSIELPNSVTTIGYSAFTACSSLEGIEIPNSVTSIGDYAFSSCSSLASIEIPNGVTTIGESTFSYCESLVSITIPRSVTEIGYEAFNGCEYLSDVYYGGTKEEWSDISIEDENDALNQANIHFAYERRVATKPTIQYSGNKDGKIVYKDGGVEVLKYGITEIAAGAYKDNKDIASVVLPSSVTTIGNEAFNFCSGLTSIEIPSSVKTIGDWAFRNCSSLTNIEIPNGVTTIGVSAFERCGSLASIKIPNSVKTIGNVAFAKCSSLTSIEIPDSVTTIDNFTFNSCSSLTNIKIPNNVKTIGRFAFSSCSSLVGIEIPNGVTTIGGSAFHGCSSLAGIEIPNGVTAIEDSTFWLCEKLAFVTIPNSVTTIGANAFYGCKYLSDIYYGGTKEEWSNISIEDENDVLHQAKKYFADERRAATKPTIQYSGNKDGKIVYKNGYEEVLKYGITEIAAGAYKDNKDIVSVVLPSSVTTIDGGIYFGAFGGCSSLESIVIPSSVTSIGKYAFDNCRSLTSIEIPNGVTTIGCRAFSRCDNLSSITIPSSVTSIGESAFESCGSLTIILSPQNKSYKAIDNNLYTYDGRTLVEYIPKKSESIVVIPNGVTTIGNSAFGFCEKLARIEIPNSVTTIGVSAFYGCSNLKNIEIPNSVTTIGDYAFHSCGSFTSITIPSSVTTIGDHAFQYCNNLSSIRIFNGITTIGTSAFYACDKITNIYYTGTKSDWSKIKIGKDNPKLKSLFGKANIHYNCQ